MKTINDKFILDACCGGRTFWFDKAHKNVLYVDVRKAEKGIVKERPRFSVQPDMLMDFRAMKFDDSTFDMVVFDPPHFSTLGPKSYMAKKYGVLDKKTWKEDLRKGFEECWRVLRPRGTLIFKWNEHEIPIGDVLKCFPEKPLFDHRSGKVSKTHWMVFMKIQ